MRHKLYTRRPLGVELLSSHLFDGTLVLFIGAGVSIGLQLPGWLDLVNAVRETAGYNRLDKDARADDLHEACDEVRYKLGEKKFFDIVKKTLYKDPPDRIRERLYKNKLLTALTAMLVSSKRGRIREVVSFNFDSMLQWYLSLFGFTVQTITKLPALVGSEDVRIYHPHGFLPHEEMSHLHDSDFLTIGLDSIDSRIGKPGDLWFERTRQLMHSGMCLFIGLSENSFKDRAISPLIKAVANEVGLERPLGFWLIYREMTGNADSFLRRSVVPIVLKDEDDIAEYLLEICRESALLLNPDND